MKKVGLVAAAIGLVAATAVTTAVISPADSTSRELTAPEGTFSIRCPLDRMTFKNAKAGAPYREGNCVSTQPTTTTTVAPTTTTLPPTTTTTTPPAGIPGVGPLAWSDEFEEHTLDTSKWAVFDRSNYGSGNREDQCYLAKNVTVKGGVLRITAQLEQVTGCGTNPDTGKGTYYVTSGAITTRDQAGTVPRGEKFAFTHGYVAARLRVSDLNALWPAFWSPPGGGAELDIFEGYGGRPLSTHATIWYPCSGTAGGCQGGKVQTSPNAFLYTDGSVGHGPNVPPPVNGGIQDWHEYGMLVTPAATTFYIDRIPLVEYRVADRSTYLWQRSTGSWAKRNTFAPSTVEWWRQAHHLMLNLAWGGSGGARNGYTGGETSVGYNAGNLTGTQPGWVEADWVRYYPLAA